MANCTDCHKFFKKLQIVIVDLNNQPKRTAELCEKCIMKLQDGPTRCSIEVNRDVKLDEIQNIFERGKKDSESIIYRCPHCKMETKKRDYFVDHSCTNFMLTKDFAKSLVEKKDE